MPKQLTFLFVVEVILQLLQPRVIEPGLKALWKCPEYTIGGCLNEDGRLSAFVVFRCPAAIRCKRYRDNGAGPFRVLSDDSASN
jgi:hypothetical protein